MIPSRVIIYIDIMVNCDRFGSGDQVYYSSESLCFRPSENVYSITLSGFKNTDEKDVKEKCVVFILRVEVLFTD